MDMVTLFYGHEQTSVPYCMEMTRRPINPMNVEYAAGYCDAFCFLFSESERSKQYCCHSYRFLLAYQFEFISDLLILSFKTKVKEYESVKHNFSQT